MRTGNLSFSQEDSRTAVAALTGPRKHSVPDDSSLRFIWDTGPSRLVLTGDIDLTTHADLLTALAKAADGTGQVHVDLAGVRFCDAAGLRMILRGGNGQQPVPAQVILHNLTPYLEKLLRLLDRDPVQDLINDVAGQAGTSTGYPGQVARSWNDGSARTPVSTPDELRIAACGRSGEGIAPGSADAVRPGTAVPGCGYGARSYGECACAYR